MHLFAFLFNKIGTIPAHTTKFILLHFCAYESFLVSTFQFKACCIFSKSKLWNHLFYLEYEYLNICMIEMNTPIHLQKQWMVIFILHSTKLIYTGCLWVGGYLRLTRIFEKRKYQSRTIELISENTKTNYNQTLSPQFRKSQYCFVSVIF